MDLARKNRIQRQIIIVLLVLNIATVVTVLTSWISATHAKKVELTSELESKQAHFFYYFLSLDSTQAVLLDSINVHFSKETNAIGIKMRDLKIKMSDQIAKNPKDTTELNKIFESFMEMHVIANLKNESYYENILEICNPVQASKLKLFFKKSTEIPQKVGEHI